MITIKELEIENFRSIVKEPLKIIFSNLTAIVGPNNSGKSNIIRALQLFFTGQVDNSAFNPELDFPKSIELPRSAQTKITVTIEFDPEKEAIISRALDELENNQDNDNKKSSQKRLDDNLVKLRLSYSKNGVESWQFIGKSGVKNVPKELTKKVRDAVRQSVVFKYIPVGRDSLESTIQELSSELVKTIFSGWSGAIKKRQDINLAIEELLNRLTPSLEKSSVTMTGSMRKVFTEVEQIELKLPFENLEEMLPSLKPILRDSAETGLKSKGAGIQTSTLLFLLKYLADNSPQRYVRTTHIWCLEEPESFLHPSKQKAMSEILQGFSQEVQTTITTHCAHFVPRSSKNSKTYVINKQSTAPWSTIITGNTYDEARVALGVSMLDAMVLHPLNIVCEGPSDQIYILGALSKLYSEAKIGSFEVRCFPANNASSASYLYEAIKSHSDQDTKVILIIDGDTPGNNALESLTKRSARKLKSGTDYIQLEKDIEHLLSDRVKELLISKHPKLVHHTRDISEKIKLFAAAGSKTELARIAIQYSDIQDLSGFQRIFEKIKKHLT